jgi:hypothetical protein
VQSDATSTIASRLIGCLETTQSIKAQLPGLRARVSRDQQAIRNLSPSFNTNTQAIDVWLEAFAESNQAAEEEAQKLLLDIGMDEVKS